MHKLSSKEEAAALKKTMDLVEHDHISWFGFDIFTRLFQPWQTIINNWNVIVCAHPGYQAYMTYDEVEAILKQFVSKPGRSDFMSWFMCRRCVYMSLLCCLCVVVLLMCRYCVVYLLILFMYCCCVVSMSLCGWVVSV